MRIKVDDVGVLPHHLKGRGLVHRLLIEFVVTEEYFLRGKDGNEGQDWIRSELSVGRGRWGRR